MAQNSVLVRLSLYSVRKDLHKFFWLFSDNYWWGNNDDLSLKIESTVMWCFLLIWTGVLYTKGQSEKNHNDTKHKETTGWKCQICLKYVNHKNSLGQTFIKRRRIAVKHIPLQYLEEVGEKLIFPCLQIWNKQNTDTVRKSNILPKLGHYDVITRT